MNTETQQRRATELRELHSENGEGLMILANAYDVSSAMMFEQAGFSAIGTTSAGIAASLGYPDGEHISRDQMLRAVERIATGVTLPVSADIEGGYGDTPEAVGETVTQMIAVGAVGVNLEDGTGPGADPLLDTETHAARIQAAREAAQAADVPIVINGRTDVYWLDVGTSDDRFDHAVRRANAYRDAGADCLFIPGVSDAETIAELVDRIDGPLNVLGGPGSPPIPELAESGVARVSIGSGPMRATLGLLNQISEELHRQGTYTTLAESVPYSELHELLMTADDSSP